MIHSDSIWKINTAHVQPERFTGEFVFWLTRLITLCDWSNNSVDRPLYPPLSRSTWVSASRDKNLNFEIGGMLSGFEMCSGTSPELCLLRVKIRWRFWKLSGLRKLTLWLKCWDVGWYSGDDTSNLFTWLLVLMMPKSVWLEIHWRSLAFIFLSAFNLSFTTAKILNKS